MLKTITRCFGFLLIMVGLAACSASPQSQAKKFATALAEGKIAEAKTYATEATGEVIDLAAGLGGIQVDPDFEFIHVETEVDGNRAVVRFRTSKGASRVETIKMVKVDGKWLAEESK